MKRTLLLFFGLIFISANAQPWFDKSCKGIDDIVLEEEFNNASKRNILKIIINQADEIEINDEVRKGLSEIAFKELILNFVTNPNGDKNKPEKPEKVIVHLKSLNKKSEKIKSIEYYIQDVYLYLWDLESADRFKSSYVDLNCKKREKVFNSVPLKIISDIDKDKKTNNLPKRRGPGLPPFGGDVKNN